MKLLKLAAIFSAAVALSVSHIAIAADDHKGHDHDNKKVSEHAHEAKPQYGGVVSVVKDVNYELIAKPDSITLYVNDHGKPVDTKGAMGTVTLLSVSDKADVTLVPAGGNKLEAKGVFKAGPGTKAVAKVTLAGKSAQNVRFTLK